MRLLIAAAGPDLTDLDGQVRNRLPATDASG